MTTIAESLLAEWNNELRATRACLERVPEDQLSWRPHAKSMSLGQLALHIAKAPAGVLMMVLPDVFPPPRGEAGLPEAGSRAEILDALEASNAVLHEQLPQLSDERMLAISRMEADGRELLALPRVAWLRMIMLNHIYHHRGQLSVYLRMLDVPLPSIYGPSADAPPAFMQ